MRGLLLVGAGGLARECLAALRSDLDPRPVLVLDDNSDLWGTTLDGAPVVGGLAEVKQHEGFEVVVCAGRGGTRQALVARLTELGVQPHRYGRVRHPSVDIPRNCRVGRGSILLAHVTLTAAATVGRHVVVMPNVTITHDDDIDDFATLDAGVALGGGVRIGTGAYLGIGSSVGRSLTVGAGATLGMGSVLLRDLPAGQTWVGVPARGVWPDCESTIST
jgi:sugar O-acyltransferase (sialic acid O-acetyltransferase NeuD family)